MLRVVAGDKASAELGSALDELVREGDRRMPAAALEAEVDASVWGLVDEVDEHGKRLVVRNSHAEPRQVATGAGPGGGSGSTGERPRCRGGYRRAAPVPQHATVWLRTKVTKGPGSRAAGLAMAFKLIEAAQHRWRSVNAPQLVALVRAGASFRNGGPMERRVDPA